MDKIKFKKLHPNAVLPTSSRVSDTGYDVSCVEDTIIPAKGSKKVETGIQVAEIPEGYWFLVSCRSGLGFKNSVYPHPGVIDQGYRGELSIKLYNLGDTDYHVSAGDRIAQLTFYKTYKFDTEWAEEVTPTERGGNGLGSSGR
jgi:dUTP pyrophosphatase